MRGKKGWKKMVSGDIKIHSIGPPGQPSKKSHIILPNHWAEAIVTPRLDIHPGHIPQVSTRSVLARLGIDIGHHAAQTMEILLTAQTPHTVIIINNGRFSVRLRRGESIHRIYFPQLIKPLRREEINKMLASGELILGKKSKVDSNGLVELPRQSIMYKFEEGSKEAIENENWASGSKRKKLMQHTKRVEGAIKLKRGKIVLTETFPVKLPKDVAMFLQSATDGTSYHIHSVIIDPGYGNPNPAPIVLEIMGLKNKAVPEKIYAWLTRITDY
ncbi:MAG: hypothetical protein Q7S21_07805 [archaeon]|nr:hypothetical protein [archaeon]